MGIISWFKGIFQPKEPLNDAPSPSTHTVQSRAEARLEWEQKVVILSVAPNSYKEWVRIEDLYQAFKDRMEAGD
jgi:hypothetical protein